jgi:flagellar biosynthesis/type III secretory pathway ATPase
MSVLTGYYDRLVQALATLVPSRARGSVVAADSSSAVAKGLAAPVGSNVVIKLSDGTLVEGEVVSVKGEDCSVELVDDATGVSSGSPVELWQHTPMVGVSVRLLGRSVDCHCRPLDGMGRIAGMTPVPMFRNTRRIQRMHRAPLGNRKAPELFRGALAATRTPWPDAGRQLSEIARAHDGPVVASLIGGSVLEHSVFSADLMEAFYRTALISMPRECRPFRALRTFRVAATIASHFASEGENVMLLVSWRVGALPSAAETTGPHDVTTIWSIEEGVTGFDVELGHGTARGRAA